DTRVNIEWIEAESFEGEPHTVVERLKDKQAILVPGGYGERGTAGMIAAIQYAREHQIPYMGICFGMQLAVIEVARHVVGIEKANTTEFGITTDPVVGLLTEWLKEGVREHRSSEGDLGGTMRLGLYPATLEPGS